MLIYYKPLHLFAGFPKYLIYPCFEHNKNNVGAEEYRREREKKARKEKSEWSSEMLNEKDYDNNENGKRLSLLLIFITFGGL